MKEKRLFVTVGTTQFEKLIETLSNDETLNLLHQMGFTHIQLQTGTGKIPPNEKHSTGMNLKLDYSPYLDNFQDAVRTSDLVISHAGAGTCLDVLHEKKPLIVVINEDLMDNHQTELADQLQAEGYLYYCTLKTLHETLGRDLSALKPYPEPDGERFPRYLDKLMGFR